MCSLQGASLICPSINNRRRHRSMFREGSSRRKSGCSRNMSATRQRSQWRSPSRYRERSVIRGHPFLFPSPCRSSQDSSRSIRKRQCDLRFPIRNAPGITPSIAWRRRVRAAIPSSSAASVRPIDRLLSDGDRIICPPSVWTLAPCMRANCHHTHSRQFMRHV